METIFFVLFIFFIACTIIGSLYTSINEYQQIGHGDILYTWETESGSRHYVVCRNESGGWFDTLTLDDGKDYTIWDFLNNKITLHDLNISK